MAHAIAMTDFVNQKTDLEISLYQALQGEPLGTLIFAYRCESFAASLESADGLVHSDEYLGKIEEGAQHFVGNAEDRLGKIQHIAGEVSGPPAAAAVVSAAIDVPQVAKAMSWSLELSDYTANLTGVPVALLTSNYGQYGTVSFGEDQLGSRVPAATRRFGGTLRRRLRRRRPVAKDRLGEPTPSHRCWIRPNPAAGRPVRGTSPEEFRSQAGRAPRRCRAGSSRAAPG
jgi:hypothetical protein